jgi:hypothetical protein
MISSSIHFPATDIISFFFMAEKYSMMAMYIIYHIFFIHSVVIGYLSWFYSLADVKRAAMNMDMQVSLLYIDLHIFRYIPKSGVAGP